MKNCIWILIFHCCLQYTAQAQDSDMKVKLYKTWIKINDEHKKARGFLYQANDSGVYLTFSSKKSDYTSGLLEKKFYSSNQIVKIETRRKGNATKGTLYGLLTGTAAGGLIGYITFGSSGGKDDYRFAGFVIGSSSGMILGTLVGTVIGSIKKSHKVNKDSSFYQPIVPNLKSISVRKD